MTKTGVEYRMSESTFKRITTKEGEEPYCRRCGVTLVPGVPVVSKRGGGKRRHRYCRSCGKKLKII